MAKKDLIAVILGLEGDLKAEGVKFESNNLTEKDNTEEQLKKEIVRLEALLPAESEEGVLGKGSVVVTGSTGEQGNPDVEDFFNIKLNKGVNIEVVVDGNRVVLEGGKTHKFCVYDAKDIIARNLGVVEE